MPSNDDVESTNAQQIWPTNRSIGMCLSVWVNLNVPKMRKMRTSGTTNNNSPYEYINDVYLS